METRREFVKNGLIICLGAAGVMLSETAHAFPQSNGKRWGMIIDSSRCTGCQSCMVACKLQNKSTPQHFNTTIKEMETGECPRTKLRFIPALCLHCAGAPCVSACPTGAAFIHDSGLVMTDWNRCDGNGACIAACPYDARFHDPRFGGRTDKCDLCINRISDGISPACVENCPSGARIFGRFDKPEGEFGRYLKRMGAKFWKKGAVHILNTHGEA